MDPAAPRHVASSQTRTRTRVPCIGRQTLNHCATRGALRTVLKSTLSDTNIAIPASLSFPFTWNTFFHPLTCLCVSLALKWVSCKQHLDGSCFFKSSQLPYVYWLRHLVHWHLKWLLIGMYRFVACFLGVFVVLLLVSSLVVWWFFLSGMLVLLSLWFLCIYCRFWFVVTMGFIYVDL